MTEPSSGSDGGADRRTVLESIPAALLGAGLVGVGGLGAGTVAGQQVGGAAGGEFDLQVIEELQTAPVAANGSDEVRLSPDGGAMTVVGMQLRAEPVVPAGAGSQTFEVALAAGDEPMPVIEGTASHDRHLQFHGLAWREADGGTTPEDETATLLTLRGTPVTGQQELVVRYHNETNARQTQMRTVRLLGATPASNG